MVIIPTLVSLLVLVALGTTTILIYAFLRKKFPQYDFTREKWGADKTAAAGDQGTPTDAEITMRALSGVAAFDADIAVDEREAVLDSIEMTGN